MRAFAGALDSLGQTYRPSLDATNFSEQLQQRKALTEQRYPCAPPSPLTRRPLSAISCIGRSGLGLQANAGHEEVCGGAAGGIVRLPSTSARALPPACLSCY